MGDGKQSGCSRHRGSSPKAYFAYTTSSEASPSNLINFAVPFKHLSEIEVIDHALDGHDALFKTTANRRPK